MKRKVLANKELVSFGNQMGMIIHAGIPVEEGISIMLEESKKKRKKRCYVPFMKNYKWEILFLNL